MILSRTPFRITLAGGGTDLPSFYENYDKGGTVLSVAIDKYVYITFKRDFFENLFKLRYSKIEIVDSFYKFQHTRAREALSHYFLTMEPCEINCCADLPSGTGLGSSASFLVGLLNTLATYTKGTTRPRRLAEAAYDIERNKLNLPVGKQDQYIAAYGGIKLFEINNKGRVDVRDYDNTSVRNLLKQIHLYYTGARRDASVILEKQDKDKTCHSALSEIYDIGIQSIMAIMSRDIGEYGRLMMQHWNEKKSLSPNISSPEIDTIFSHTANKCGVIGHKLVGAGGGGFMMFLVENDGKKLDDYMVSIGHYQKLNFGVDTKGSTVILNI